MRDMPNMLNGQVSPSKQPLNGFVATNPGILKKLIFEIIFCFQLIPQINVSPFVIQLMDGNDSAPSPKEGTL